MGKAQTTDPGVGVSSTTEHESCYTDHSYKIVDWEISRKVSAVTLTLRLPDGSTRKESEEAVQQRDEDAVINYWKSFGQPREVTIKCDSYRIFKILQHNADEKKVQVHWVGYAASEASATWEPVSNLLRTSDKSVVLEYLKRYELTKVMVGTPKAAKSKLSATYRKRGRGSTDTSSDGAKRPRTVGTEGIAALPSTPDSKTMDSLPQQSAETHPTPVKEKGFQSDGNNPCSPETKRLATVVTDSLALSFTRSTFTPPLTIASPSFGHHTGTSAAGSKSSHPRLRPLRAASEPATTQAISKNVLTTGNITCPHSPDTVDYAPDIKGNKVLSGTSRSAQSPFRLDKQRGTSPKNMTRRDAVLSHPVTQMPWHLTADEVAVIGSPKGCLNDKHVNALCGMAVALSHSLVTVDSCVTDPQGPSKAAIPQDRLWSGKLSRGRKILCPLHMVDHWTLLVLELDTKRAILYDSLQDPKSPIKAELLQHIKGLTQRLLEDPDQSSDTWKFERDFCPKQKNTYDCGVYVLVLVFYISAERPIPTQFNVLVWREIFKHLCSSESDQSSNDSFLTLHTNCSPHALGSSNDYTEENIAPIAEISIEKSIEHANELGNFFLMVSKAAQGLKEGLTILLILRNRHDALLLRVQSRGSEIQKALKKRQVAYESLGPSFKGFGAWNNRELESQGAYIRKLRQWRKDNIRWCGAIDDVCERLDSCSLKIQSVIGGFADEQKRLLNQMKAQLQALDD